MDANASYFILFFILLLLFNELLRFFRGIQLLILNNLFLSIVCLCLVSLNTSTYTRLCIEILEIFS